MSRTSPESIVASAIVVGMLSIALLCGIVVSLFDVWRADRAKTWPTTNGVVVESRSAEGCGRRGNLYFQVVRYRYQAGGVGYESGRILFGEARCESRKAAKSTLERFHVGAVVKVSFDPQAPAEAVLIAGKVDDSAWAAISFLSLWFFLAAAVTGMLAIVARSSRRPDPRLPTQRALGERSYTKR